MINGLKVLFGAILALMLYVFTNDVRRIARDTRQATEEKQPSEAPKSVPPTEAPVPAPARP